MLLKSKLKRAFLHIRHYGSKCQCPVCGYNTSGFLSAGLYAKRVNSKCASCGSLERHRQLILIIRELFEKGLGKNILHFAPEKCLVLAIKQHKINSYKTSHFETKMDSDYHFDIQNIESPSAIYDMIICSHVLEHVDHDLQAMQEIHRILKLGGIALIQVPMWYSEKHKTYENSEITDEYDRIIHFGQFDHVRIYGLDVIDRLRDSGFEVETIDLNQSMDKEESRKFGLKNHDGVRDITFICTKP